MANGTIAFDTLSTSGQISGTAKSVDADYLLNGSAKHFCHHDGGTTIDVSFNTASFTDNGTGDYTSTFTNNLSVLDSPFLGFSGHFHTTDDTSLTSSCTVNLFNNSHAAADSSRVTTLCLGDLA